MGSLNTKAVYERELDPKINKVDTTFFLQVYGPPKEKLDRTWQYYFEKVDGRYENRSTIPENYYEKEFEILYLTFNKNGIFVSWDIMAYKEGLY